MLDLRLDYAVSNQSTLSTSEWIAPVFAFGGAPRVNANVRTEAGMHIPGTVGAPSA
jgi:hypothetical protein